MYINSEHCGRCGAVIYAFSSKRAASSNSLYCIRCAEELDREYLAKNICSSCTRLISGKEAKFVMPSRLYSNYFFDKLPLENRLMCLQCYKRASKLSLIRRPLMKIGGIRAMLGMNIYKMPAIKASRARNS